MESTFPDYIHCDTACVGVNAGIVFLSDSCNSVTRWQPQSLAALQIIIILQLSSFFDTAALANPVCPGYTHTQLVQSTIITPSGADDQPEIASDCMSVLKYYCSNQSYCYS